MAFVQGSSGADFLFGTPGDDVILARGGDDVIHASRGDDVIDGDAGVDRLVIGEDVTGLNTMEYIWIEADNFSVGTPFGASFTTTFSSIEHVSLQGTFHNAVIDASGFVPGPSGFNSFTVAGVGSVSLAGTSGSDMIEMTAGASSTKLTARGGGGEDWLRLNLDFGPITFSTEGATTRLHQNGRIVANVTEIDHLSVASIWGGLTIDASASGMGIEFLTTRESDTIIGSAFGDVFTAAPKASPGRSEQRDTYTGGGGADIFAFSFASDSYVNATITDFTPGEDRIDLGESGLGSLLQLRAFLTQQGNDVLLHAEGSAAFFNLVLQNVQISQLADADFGWAARNSGARSDFNGDSLSDILWRGADGAVSYWAGTGSGFDSATGVYLPVAKAWQVAAVGDLNGDGIADILWRNDDGGLTYWAGTGSGLNPSTGFFAQVGTDWRVEGAADFNGDGIDDVLWRSDGGQVAVWTGTGSGFDMTGFVVPNVGPQWQVAGTGDFNGDGMDDILWRSGTDGVTAWLSTGTGFDAGGSVQLVGAEWQVAGVEDFDGDGRDDILWRSDSGGVAVWTSNGSSFEGGSFPALQVDSGWQVAATGDYNGDGFGDILWRDVAGTLATWEGTGTGFNAATGFYQHVDPSWSVISG